MAVDSSSSSDDAIDVDLDDFIARCPIIDNHCHALLPWSEQSHDAAELLTVTSEATGEALSKHARSTLAHARAVRQLCDFEGLGTSSVSGTSGDFERYLAHRRTLKEEDITRRSLAGIYTLLVDDGLRSRITPHPYSWHDRYVTAPCKRIVRIETLAEDLYSTPGELEQDLLENGMRDLVDAIEDALDDPEVVGFKSAICYRTGLDIHVPSGSDALLFSEADVEALEVAGAFDPSRRRSPRFSSKAFNDKLVCLLAFRIEQRVARGEFAKSIQFHTGLGDNDLTLTKANPAHLQNFIAAHPRVPVVILHSAYPFTREAGYLASTYNNAYLDIGEIFPMVSRSGQESALRQALEITPTSKLCWSTDGHFFQETYSLGVLQIREAFGVVLKDMIARRDVDESFAKRIVRDLLFDTSNKLYGLNHKFELYGMQPERTSRSTAIGSLQSASQDNPNQRAAISKGKDGLPTLLEDHCKRHREAKYVRVNWVDYTATVRTRVFTVEHVLKCLRDPGPSKGAVAGIVTVGNFNLQDDTSGSPDLPSTGEWLLCPDFERIYVHPRTVHINTSDGRAATKHSTRMPYLDVMSRFLHADGKTLDETCPRNMFQRAIAQAEEAGVENIKFGCEIEFCLVEMEPLERRSEVVPISVAHAWSTSRALQAESGKALQILEDIMDALKVAGVEVYTFHSESAPGQYEIPLGPLPPMQAMDQLIYAREVITYISALHGYRATMHPKPWPDGAGSGAHLHMSFSASDQSVSDSAWAGILDHLPSIVAYTLAGEDSYLRVQDNAWSGGTWCMWGDQNREAALRRIDADGNHWEMKTFDGFANPYLAGAAILHAARLGVEAGTKLMRPCGVNASTLSDAERAELGITKRLPRSLPEALANLASPGNLLADALGEEAVKRYQVVKREEMALLKRIEGERGQAARRAWLVMRY